MPWSVKGKRVGGHDENIQVSEPRPTDSHWCLIMVWGWVYKGYLLLEVGGPIATSET